MQSAPYRDYQGEKETDTLAPRGRGPSFEVTLRRFFRDVQQSGILSEIKKRRFREKSLSRSKLRVIARRKAVRKRIKRGY